MDRPSPSTASPAAHAAPRPISWPGSLIAGLLHIGFFALSFPPYDWWPLIYLSLLPVALLALRTTSRWRAVVGAYVPAALGWLWMQRWMIDVTAPGYVLLCLAQALFPAAFVFLLATLRPRGKPPVIPGLTNTLLVPLLWVGLEFLRGRVAFTGYPWFLLGHPLIHAPLLCQTADLLGTYWVSFTAGMFAGLACDLLTLPLFRDGRLAPTFRNAVAAFLIAQGVVLGYGLWQSHRTRHAVAASASRAHSVTVAAVQTNLPQSNKMEWSAQDQIRDFGRFVDLTLMAVEADRSNPNVDVDLIVWPETMVPGFPLNVEAIDALNRIRQQRGEASRGTFYFNTLADAARRLSTPLLVGAAAVNGLRLDEAGDRFEWDDRYNSAILFLPDGTQAQHRYDKMHLTPFGEIIPYLHHWPGLQQWIVGLGARGMSFDLAFGTVPTRLIVPLENGAPPTDQEGQAATTAPATQPSSDSIAAVSGRALSEIRVAAPICFESTMAPICRRLIKPGHGEPKADLLVNMTNDGWFGRAAGGRELHLHTARFRAIENRVPMIRCANTGISSAIDSYGSIVEYGPNLPPGTPSAFSEGVMRATLLLDGRVTLYTSTFGDAFGWVCLALTVGLFLAARARAWNARRGARITGAPAADGNDATLPTGGSRP